MSRIDPTPEQLAIIHSPDHRLVVTAAAGAGKTFVLVERYLTYIREGFSPGQILTITFTRKAAAEMKRRIVLNLREMGRTQDAQVAETGPIGTIHSFCERLLRENALEAGLDPRFEILSDTESGRLRDQAIREAISSPDISGSEADQLIASLAGKRRYGSASPYGRLEQSISDLINGLRGTGLRLDDIRESYCTPAGLDSCFREKILAEMPFPIAERIRREGEGNLHQQLIAAYKDWGERPERWIASKPNIEDDALSLWQTVGLFQLGADAWENYERAINKLQKLDFTSLESRAIDLLQRSEVTRERLGSQYAVIMVDEAQDVNPLQDELIKLMSIEREMIVGDPQQSIYGFRLADPSRLQGRAKAEGALAISKNQRSDAGILRAVDLVFGSLWDEYTPMTPPPKPMDFEVIELPFYQGVEIWSQRTEQLDTVAKWLIEASVEHDFQWRDVAVLVRTSEFALRVKSAFDRHNIPSRIAGGTESFYARLEIRDLANTLQALANPHDDFALLAMLRSPIVQLSLDSVALLAQHKPVFDNLRTTELTVAEDAAKIAKFLDWFEPMHEIADRVPAWEMLSTLMSSSDYLPALGSRRTGLQELANVRKLLRLASSEPTLGPLDYAEQIREIQNLRHREGDAPVADESQPMVTIMTIHKAKGLEWPVVLIPEMHRNLGGSSRELEVDPKERIAATKFGKSSFYHAWLQKKRQERDSAEELRLLYVAMTRARKRLFAVANPGAPNGSMGRRLASAVGMNSKPPAGFVVRSDEAE